MNDAKTNPPRFVLVVGIDATPDAKQVLDAATRFVRETEATELHLVHAVEPYETEGFPVAEAYERAMNRGRAYLDESAKGVATATGLRVTGHLRNAPAARAILQTATSLDADMVIVGTHDRRGISRWALGSVSERVTRDAACPVLVVRPKSHGASPSTDIDPPCPDCVRVQRETKGATLWCPRHAEHHPHGHIRYEIPEGFGAGSSLIRP